MTQKIGRLAKAFNNESVKRLPYIILVFLLLSVYQLVKVNSQTAQTAESAKQLLTKVAALSIDNKRLNEQNHALTKQNNDLSQKISNQVNCQLQLFAQFTRTYMPIQPSDLTSCVISLVKTPATAATSPVSESQQSLSNPVVSSGSSSQSAPQTTPSQSNNSPTTPTPTPTPPATPNCTVDVLFIHLLC